MNAKRIAQPLWSFLSRVIGLSYLTTCFSHELHDQVKIKMPRCPVWASCLRKRPHNEQYTSCSYLYLFRTRESVRSERVHIRLHPQSSCENRGQRGRETFLPRPSSPSLFSARDNVCGKGLKTEEKKFTLCLNTPFGLFTFT